MEDAAVLTNLAARYDRGAVRDGTGLPSGVGNPVASVTTPMTTGTAVNFSEVLTG